MVEDIRKGEQVRVLVAGLFHNQECQVLHIEHNTERRRKLSDTWYLLDTRDAKYKWSHPAWFERHEIERVMPEERGAV